MGSIQADPFSTFFIAQQRALRTPQVQTLDPEYRLEIMKMIAELEKTRTQTGMEAIETYGMIQDNILQAQASVIEAVVGARGQLGAAANQKNAEAANIVVSLIGELYDNQSDFVKEIENETNALAGAASVVARQVGDPSQIPPKEFVNQYLQNLKQGLADPTAATGAQASRIRLAQNTRDTLESAPSDRMRTASSATILTQNALLQGLREAVGPLPPGQLEMMEDQFLQQVNTIDLGMSGQFTKEERAQIDDEKLQKKQLMQDALQRFDSVSGLPNAEYFLGLLDMGDMENLVGPDGIKGLAKQLEDTTFTPQTDETIEELKSTLKDDEAKMDAFQRGMLEIQKIPGSKNMRRALGLEDDFAFAAYVSRSPNAFATAMRTVNEAANASTDSTISDFDPTRMSALVAGSLTMRRNGEKNVGKAIRVARNPRRLRRLLRREGRADTKDQIRAYLEDDGKVDLNVDAIENAVAKAKLEEQNQSAVKTADTDEDAAQQKEDTTAAAPPPTAPSAQAAAQVQQAAQAQADADAQAAQAQADKNRLSEVTSNIAQLTLLGKQPPTLETANVAQYMRPGDEVVFTDPVEVTGFKETKDFIPPVAPTSKEKKPPVTMPDLKSIQPKRLVDLGAAGSGTLDKSRREAASLQKRIDEAQKSGFAVSFPRISSVGSGVATIPTKEGLKKYSAIIRDTKTGTIDYVDKSGQTVQTFSGMPTSVSPVETTGPTPTDSPLGINQMKPASDNRSTNLANRFGGSSQ